MNESHDQLLGLWMHRIGFAFKGHVDSQVQKLGLRAPDAMLMMKIANEGSTSLVELSKIIGHAHTSILRHIDSLEEKGFLTREPHPNDRRMKVVSLTDKGHKILPKIKTIISEIHDQALLQFSIAEKEQLFSLFGRILDNLTNSELNPEVEGTE